MENIVIPNYNKYSKLTLIKKIEELLSMHIRASGLGSLEIGILSRFGLGEFDEPTD